MKPQITDPLEERLNKPTEVIETFRELLPSDQLDVYEILFRLFSPSKQESLLDVLHEIHQEAGDDEDDEDD